MIHENTVLILGAGASQPFGYLTMKDLRSDIIDNFYKYYDQWILKYINDEYERREKQQYVKDFVKRYTESELIIDQFLSEQDDSKIIRLGKLAIVCSINRCEKEHRLKLDNNIAKSDWYGLLYSYLFDSLPVGQKYQFSKHNLSIITFNYDRSFEHFLFKSLVAAYPKKATNIADEINKIEIIHVYGQLMRLGWQDSIHLTQKDYQHYNEYGKINAAQLYSCSENIDVMYNSQNDIQKLSSIQKLISEAKHIFFLGFGFHDFNLDIIGIPKAIKKSHNIYWTNRGLGSRKKMNVENLFNQKKEMSANRLAVDGKCYELVELTLIE